MIQLRKVYLEGYTYIIAAPGGVIFLQFLRWVQELKTNV